MSENTSCPNEGCSGVSKEMPSQEISLPTPESEVVFGGGSPSYSATIELPLVYCLECDQVFFAGDDKNQPPNQLQVE